jgi:transposase-like protein
MKHYHCPNPDCKHHTEPAKGWYVKNGYYKTKHNHQPVPRYKCKACKTNFSSHTFRDTYKQKRPELNKLIFKMYSSNTSQNRLAKVLGCNRKTVVKKIRFLACKARNIHEAKLKTEFEIRVVQFDEMETFEHTRKKPVSISIAVEVERFEKDGKWFYRAGRIIDAIAGSMPCKGWLAAKSRELYGNREDQRYECGMDVLESVKTASSERLKIMSDGKRAYPNMFAEVLPQAEIAVVNRKQNQGSEYDPMFSLNHTCALLRHDLSRLARKSWVTTKNIEGLQYHLDLYLAYRNGYVL